MVAPWCVGTVTSQVGDQYAVNVILDGGGMGGQIGAVPCDVITHGPRDALRINQHPLPTKGTRVLVAFPRGDSRNGVVVGSLGNTQNDASAFAPGIENIRYQADWSGYWEIHDEAGHHAGIYPDGSSWLVGYSGIPTVTRHTVTSGQVRQRTPFTQAQRVTTPPTGSFPFYYKQPTGAAVSINSSGAISVNSADGQPLTFFVSGGASVTLTSGGGVNITAVNGHDINLIVDSGAKVNLGHSPTKKVVLDNDPVSGGQVNSTAVNVYGS